jgi:hypothetical protein
MATSQPPSNACASAAHAPVEPELPELELEDPDEEPDELELALDVPDEPPAFEPVEDPDEELDEPEEPEPLQAASSEATKINERWRVMQRFCASPMPGIRARKRTKSPLR